MTASLVKDLKNRFDFFLRSRLTWGRKIELDEKAHPQAVRFQEELTAFLTLFSWSKYLTLSQRDRLSLADVGTRTFASAVSFSAVFQPVVKNLEIHGFEIDAYRRFTNFRTRADYGKYYASQVTSGHFHALDFTKWQGPFDVIAMLHPFVTPEPLQAWGLPLREFKPEKLFEHCAKSLEKSHGLLLLSSPNGEEFGKALALAQAGGFTLLEKQSWLPQAEDSLQRQPRLGALLRLTV